MIATVVSYSTWWVSKPLYKGSEGIAIRYFPPWEFTSKLSLDKNRTDFVAK